VSRLLRVLFCFVFVQFSFAQAVSAGNEFSVPASDKWIDTNIDLKAGDVVTITAIDPTADCNPRGEGAPSDKLPVPSGAPGALIAKLSAQDPAPVLIGANKLLPVNQPGHLFLGVNGTSSCKDAFKVKVQMGGGAADAANSVKSKLANAAQIWMSGQFGNASQPTTVQPASSTQPATAAMSETAAVPTTAAPASNSSNIGTALTPVKELKIASDPIDQKLADGINSLPRRVNDEFKNLGDMTNFVIVGTDKQVKDAFEAAKWHIADLDTKQSIAKAVLLTMQKQDYMTMPMSQLYLFDRVQDFGYEQGEAYAVVASRHHFRLWKAPFQWNGEDVWIGAGTHDIGFEKDQRNGKTTHKIDPAVDGERDHIGETLQQAGQVQTLRYFTPKNAITEARNATGGGYHSDGRVLVVFLGEGK
jgi:LssY-like putative type I secretion system component LssY